MTIDWQHEHVIPLRDVPKHVKSRVSGKKMAIATAWRWAMRKNNPLETFKSPGGRFTSIEAIDRFLSRWTAPDEGVVPGGNDAEQQKSLSQRAIDAGRELDKLLRTNGK